MASQKTTPKLFLQQLRQCELILVVLMLPGSEMIFILPMEIFPTSQLYRHHTLLILSPIWQQTQICDNSPFSFLSLRRN